MAGPVQSGAAAGARPVIFSGPMVKALLAGEKTQTRRIVKGLPDPAHNVRLLHGYLKCDAQSGEGAVSRRIPCPYGWTGDRLWVRETFASHDPQIVGYAADGWKGAVCSTGEGRLFLFHAWIVGSGADREQSGGWVGLGAVGGRWRSPIHMPRLFSRLTLEIERVHVERVQSISEEDARAEGVGRESGTYRASFAAKWSELHGSASWAANPHVWALTFRVVERWGAAA